MKSQYPKLIFICLLALSLTSKAGGWEKVYEQYPNPNSAIVKLDSGGYMLFQTAQIGIRLNAYAIRLNENFEILSSKVHLSSENVLCKRANISVFDHNNFILQYEREGFSGTYDFAAIDSAGEYINEGWYATAAANAQMGIITQRMLYSKNTNDILGFGTKLIVLSNGFRIDNCINIKRFKSGFSPYQRTDTIIDLRNTIDTLLGLAQGNAMYPLKDGSFMLLFSKDTDTSASVSNAYYLAKFNNNGQLLFTTPVLDSGIVMYNQNLYVENDGTMYFTYSQGGYVTNGFIKMLDSTGQVLRSIVTPELAIAPYNTIVKRLDDDNLLVYSLTETPNAAMRSSFKGVYSLSTNKFRYAKYKPVFSGYFGQYDNFVASSQFITDDGIILIGNSKKKLSSDGALTIIKLEDEIYSQIIHGNVYGDYNNNCSQESGDYPFSQITVRARKDSIYYFATTDTLGNYELEVDSGNVELNIYRNLDMPLWLVSGCSSPYHVTMQLNDTTTHDFAMIPKIICPYLIVNISAPFIRRCFGNTYTVTYSNKGTISTPNAYVDVKLDSVLRYDSSSVPAVFIGNSTYRFNLGALSQQQSGMFTISTLLECQSAAILGQTICTEAHIYPDTVCTSTAYLGPIITATAICTGNKVEFILKNNGGNMLVPRKYEIIEDHVIRIMNNYQLHSDSAATFSIRTNDGATYRIIAEQDPNYPVEYGDKFVLAFTEGCREDIGSVFSTGIITSGPLFDGEPYRSLDCQQAIGSYDPNDKTGYPTGVGVEKFIDINTPVDYLIRFQNTGTDTAFKVVVIDTISSLLDINSIKNLQSSHNVMFERIDSNVISWTFNNIKLVDSFTNEPLSHGFVRFSIQQKPNLALMSQIYNSAQIYFDFNLPVATNTTLHTIGENFLRVQLITDIINVDFDIDKIEVFPNPFSASTQLIMHGNMINNAVLELTDIMGRNVCTQESKNNKFDIQRNDLPAGMYFYNIKKSTTLIATGKLIAQ